MDRFADELRDVPAERRTAARRFLRADYAAGRLVFFWIAAVLALGALVFAVFALLELATNGPSAALRGLIVPSLLAIAAVWTARRTPRRFTDMDPS